MADQQRLRKDTNDPDLLSMPLEFLCRKDAVEAEEAEYNKKTTHTLQKEQQPPPSELARRDTMDDDLLSAPLNELCAAEKPNLEDTPVFEKVSKLMDKHRNY